MIDVLQKRAKLSQVPLYNLAIIYIALGDLDQGFELLERSYEDRNYYLTRMMVDPKLVGIRSDARFMSLAKRIGLAK